MERERRSKREKKGVREREKKVGVSKIG